MSRPAPAGVPRPTPKPSEAVQQPPRRPESTTEAEAIHLQWWDVASCGDCVVWIANHDDSGLEDADDFHARFAAGTAGLEMVVACSDEDNDGWFSRHACDTCGALAGQRYIVHAQAIPQAIAESIAD